MNASETPHRSLLCSVEKASGIPITEADAINILSLSVAAIRGVILALPTRLLPKDERKWMLSANKIIEDEIENICGRM